MAPPTKKELKRGAYGYGDDAENYEFLRTCNPNADRGNWDRQDGSEGPATERYDDERGYRRGEGAYSAQGGDGALFNLMPDESQERNLDALVGLDDDATGMGSESALLGGGGPLTKGRGIGSNKPPTPNTGPRTNARRS